MCHRCSQFESETKIHTPEILNDVLAEAGRGVADGDLQIVTGDLAWFDIVDCRLRSTECGAEFHLTCETYHGAGGEWRPVRDP